VHFRIDLIPCQEFCATVFSLCAEIFNFAVFSLIFDARKKIINALDRIIPCQDFLFLPDF